MQLRPVSKLSLGQVLAQGRRQAAVARGPDGGPLTLVQWHIRPRGSGPVVDSLVRDARGTWEEGPALTQNSLNDPGEMRSHLLVLSRRARRPEHVHVLVHFADEFATNLQKATLEGRLPRAQMLAYSPQDALSEQVTTFLGDSVWVDCPFQKPHLLAPRLRRARIAAIVEGMESACPSGLFRLSALPAPLEAACCALGISMFAGREPFAAWLYYAGFSLLVSFAADGSPVGLRALSHDSGSLPSGVAKAVNEFLMGCDMVGCGLTVLPCGPQPPEDAQKVLLAGFEAGRGGGRPLFDPAKFQVIDGEEFRAAAARFGIPAHVPGVWPEHLVWCDGFWRSAGGAAVHLRGVMAENWYHREPAQEAAILPAPMVPMFRLSGLPTTLLWLAAVACVVLAALWWWKVSLEPAWQMTPQIVEADRSRNAAAGADLAHLEYVADNFGTRSSAALTPHVLNAMFPHGSGARVTRVRYTATPVIPAESRPDPRGYQRAGVERTWVISGDAEERALSRFQELADPRRVHAILAESARALGCPGAVPAEASDVVPSNQTGRPTAIEGQTRYPFEFTIQARSPAGAAGALRVPR